jgi:putative zinc finger/helix-turn-helix YgiT family protein
MTNECSLCGHEMEETRGDYPFPESGLPNVLLKDIRLLKCPECGNVEPLIHRAKHLMRALALAVLHKPIPLCGAEIRFIRKHVGLKAVELAGLIGVDKTTVSKWENDQDPIGPQSDRLVRLIIRDRIMAEELHSASVEAVRKRRYGKLLNLIDEECKADGFDELTEMLGIERDGKTACTGISIRDEEGKYSYDFV